jgi:hypothetical protein
VHVPEILVPHVGNITQVTHVRSTLLQSSLAGLRERGHFAAWSDQIAPAHRAVILETVAPVWVPSEVASAHYLACEAMKLSQAEQIVLSEALGSRVQGLFLSSVTKAAKQAGVTPWTPVPHFGRVWARLFMGGSAQLSKVGPKDLHVEIKGLALVQVPYFRLGFTAIVRAALVLFGARSAYAKVTGYRDGSDELTFLASWA